MGSKVVSVFPHFLGGKTQPCNNPRQGATWNVHQSGAKLHKISSDMI